MRGRCSGTGELEDSPRTGAAWRHAHLDDYIMHESDFQSTVFNEDDDPCLDPQESFHDRVEVEMVDWCASANAT